MKKFHALALFAITLVASQAAMAEINNVTASADAANREAALKKLQETLDGNCKGYGGTPVQGSLKIVFEKPLPTGKYFIDGTMQCDIPQK